MRPTMNKIGKYILMSALGYNEKRKTVSVDIGYVRKDNPDVVIYNVPIKNVMNVKTYKIKWYVKLVFYILAFITER